MNVDRHQVTYLSSVRLVVQGHDTVVEYLIGPRHGHPGINVKYLSLAFKFYFSPDIHFERWIY